MQAEAPAGGALDADAFQRLYPAEYYKEFLSQGIRPDGRKFHEARETTVGVDVVSTADASALIRIGSSAAMAGVKMEVRLHPAAEQVHNSRDCQPVKKYSFIAGNPLGGAASRGPLGDQHCRDSPDLPAQ